MDALSNIAQVHVITEKGEFEEDIKRYFIEHPEKKQNLHFYFVERGKDNPLLLKLWPPSYYWFYRRWQNKAEQIDKIYRSILEKKTCESHLLDNIYFE